MQPGAAAGDLRIYWKDAMPEDGENLIFIPEAQNFSFLCVTSFSKQNPYFQLLNCYYGEIQVTSGDSLSPAHNPWISLSLADLSQLGDNVGIQQVHYWKSTI
jgi:hypothetical protein